MIIKILLKYILGYVNISVEGYYIERFINLCAKEKIVLWNIKRKLGTRISANIGINDFKKIIKICKKVQCKVKIKEKRGFRFLLYKYRKRKIFLFLILIIVTMLGLTSNFIWNIEIKTQEGEKILGIIEDLKEAGVDVGTAKKDINIKQIISDIQLKRQDIAWMGIELKGTSLIVKLVKSVEKPKLEEQSNNNIVAQKPGIIKKVTAKSGSIRVEEGELVKKGDILIEGIMEGLYTEARLVPASGEVIARVWYTKTMEVPLKSIKQEETGRNENKYTIKIKDFSLNLFKNSTKYKIYDTIEEEIKLKIFKNFYLPITIIKKSNKELKEIEQKFTAEEAKSLGIQELFRRIENELEGKIKNKQNVINKNITAKTNKDFVEVTVTYEVVENIAEKDKMEY